VTKKYGTLTRIALFCALLAVCAWIAIPFEPPFTLQTFAVFLCVGLLGGKYACVSVLCYLILGAVGIPVFSGFRSGVAQLVGPTGGFLLGFLPAVLITGYLPNKLPLFVRMLFGLIVCYACGTAWYCILYANDAGMGGFLAAVLRNVLPFVLPDLVKLFLAAKATEQLQKRL